MKTKLIKIIAIPAVASSLLLANAPKISDVEKSIKTPSIKKEDKKLIEIGGIKKYTPPMKSLSTQRVLIKDIVIEGAIHISNDKLQELIKDYKNKSLNFDEIQNIASIITKYYRDNGYFVTRAYLPMQDIVKNGDILKVSVIEGNYGEFVLKNNSITKDYVVQALLDDAKRDNIVSTNTLERSMLIINDTPGVVVTQADVRPGQKVGTSDFIITTQASKRYSGYLIGDNHGSRYTGKYRVMGGVSVNSPFGIGDKLSINLLASKGANLKNGSISYSSLLHPRGLRGEISYSDTSYSLTKEYANLDATGRSKSLQIGLKYPIKRTRLENLNLGLNIAHKELKDEVKSTLDETKKRVVNATVSLEYNLDSIFLSKFDSQTVASIAYTYGKLDFKDSAKEAIDEAGAKTNGTYSKVNLSLAKKVIFTDNLLLENLFKAQFALGNKNLDGSEDFSIGGSSGVKVYPDAESSAERGFLANIELKYQLPTYNNLFSQMGLFYDIGRVDMANESVVKFESRTLQDVGLGYYGEYKGAFIKTQVAFALGNEEVTSEPVNEHKVLLQLGWSF
jgi:hemolysin activation/secretion protein